MPILSLFNAAYKPKTRKNLSSAPAFDGSRDRFQTFLSENGAPLLLGVYRLPPFFRNAEIPGITMTHLKIRCVATVEEAFFAIDDVGPYGLDVCSGVRTDGRLGPTKLAGFIDAMKAE